MYYVNEESLLINDIFDLQAKHSSGKKKHKKTCADEFL